MNLYILILILKIAWFPGWLEQCIGSNAITASANAATVSSSASVLKRNGIFLDDLIQIRFFLGKWKFLKKTGWHNRCFNYERATGEYSLGVVFVRLLSLGHPQNYLSFFINIPIMLRWDYTIQLLDHDMKCSFTFRASLGTAARVITLHFRYGFEASLMCDWLAFSEVFYSHSEVSLRSPRKKNHF